MNATDPTSQLDPAVGRLLTVLSLGAIRDAAPASLAARREAFRGLMRLSDTGARVGSVDDRWIDGPGGMLALRIYAPLQGSRGLLPGLVYLHGGGLTCGDLDTHDKLCRALCEATGCRVIAVDYRLAPEHPLPAAVQDALAATLWTIDYAAELGLDAGRIGIAGDSAGGTLAAVVCQLVARTRPGALALQLLLCPILDWTEPTPSRRAFARGYLLDADAMAQDLADALPAGWDAGHPYVSPLHAPDLAGLPPTQIHTAEFDPLRDEGDAYAERLARAGVAVRHSRHRGMIHLFYGFGQVVPHARATLRQIGAEVSMMLSPEAVA